MASKKYSAYIGIWQIEDNEAESRKGFVLNTNLEALSAAAAQGHPPRKLREDTDTSQAAPKESQGALDATISRIVDSNHSQAELLFISSFLVEAYPGMIVEREIVSPLEKSGDVVEVVKNTTIYGVTDDKFKRVLSSLERMSRIENGMKALPSALLMSIVANFDSTIADVVRDMLTLKSEMFQTGARTILLSDALRAESIADLREKAIVDEIYQFSRGSHEEQVQYIESNFHVSIKDHWKRWPDFIEVFERRNLVAHGEKTFTKRYVSICTKNGHKGSEKILDLPVELTSNYLRQAANILLEFSLLLVFSLWRKHFPLEEQKAFSRLNMAAFRLIETKNFEVAIRVLEFALGLKNTTAEDRIRKMMYVNLASAHKHLGGDEQCLRTLSGVDWSGSSDDFKVCVAALKGDIERVTRLMALVASSGAITKESFRVWPVFKFIRDNDEFLGKFAEVFNEPYREETHPKTIELVETSGELIDKSDAVTMH